MFLSKKYLLLFVPIIGFLNLKKRKSPEDLIVEDMDTFLTKYAGILFDTIWEREQDYIHLMDVIKKNKQAPRHIKIKMYNKITSNLSSALFFFKVLDDLL
jgi:hypothetical protein